MGREIRYIAAVSALAATCLSCYRWLEGIVFRKYTQ